MTITCHLRVLLLRQMSNRPNRKTYIVCAALQEKAVSLSVLASLHTGRSQRVDYTTIDRLLNYFAITSMST
jgi:hypothetical protein